MYILYSKLYIPNPLLILFCSKGFNSKNAGENNNNNKGIIQLNTPNKLLKERDYIQN